MKKIFIVTERRADFSRFKPIIKLIQKAKSLSYDLVVTGIHLNKNFGFTKNEILEEKFSIFDEFKIFDKDYYIKNDGSSMSVALGKAMMKLPKIIAKSKPDLILSGFDIAANFAVAVCGAHMNIPVAHIQGGEVSGTIDESIRHAMSKFSNFHFTATNETKNRLIKMGEKKENIFVVGCPSIDALNQEKEEDYQKIKKKFKIDIYGSYVVIIQHPVTTEINDVHKQFVETIEALKKIKIQKLFVFPNNDAGSSKIINMIKRYNFNHCQTLSLKEYKTLLKNSSALIGNSSSGIHEAATYKIPVINIGTRQEGRTKPVNVINVDYSRKEIYNSIKRVLKPTFKKKLRF
ncbi:MAG: UDP-N-acetylglucosamine 2-epimerase, partial [Flavobacteriaceae bacterium]|nr:UDP-N-acetylglucosamine 2-epimerase [Flavobacteriaceae bacterium]